MTQSGGRRRLGRGLEALLGPTSVTEARAEGALVQLPLGAIRPNPYQPRHAFDEAALEELADSMRQSGLLQPVVVRPAHGKYELIAGERRWRAAQRLGWDEIGAIVRDVDDRTLLTLALVENLQRDALSPIDEAQGYQRLIDEFGAQQSDVAELVGRDRSTVANALRLLKLPVAVQSFIHTGKISSGHARALIGAGDPKRIEALAERIASQAMSVRQVEELVRNGKPRGKRETKPAAANDTESRRVEDALRRRLQTDVKVTRRGKSGRVIVNYYSNDDLARILELILGEPYDG